MDTYELCALCGSPVINPRNIQIFRKRMITYIIGGGLIGGALGLLALPLLGFGLAGVTSGSIAAAWQSSIGLVSAGSVFAILQSLGATGTGILLFGAIGTVTSGGAVTILTNYASELGWCSCQQANN